MGATNKDNEIASYSNYGQNLDLVAPGGEYLGLKTLSPYDGYTDDFVGTSASAPLVSVAIALMLEKNPNLTRVQIEKILKDSATKIGLDTGVYSYDLNGHNDYYGYGKLNVKKALEMVPLN